MSTLADVKQFQKRERAKSKAGRVVPVLLILARRHIRGVKNAQAAASWAIASSAYVEVTPLPDDWYEVAVKIDRAGVLPTVDGLNCVEPITEG
jgi:hypothetical protein